MYKAKKARGKHRSHTKLRSESSHTSERITKYLHSIIGTFGGHPPEKTKVAVLGFGSFARDEMTIVSDIDLQIMVQTNKEHRQAGQAYAEGLKKHIDKEWASQRTKKKKPNKVRPALTIDWMPKRSPDGIVVRTDTAGLLTDMKPDMESGNSTNVLDIHTDAKVIFENDTGFYEALRETSGSSKYGAERLLGMVDSALVAWADAETAAKAQLTSKSPKSVSVKQVFLRSPTVIVGWLYRLAKSQERKPTPYLAGTLERAGFLQSTGALSAQAVADIQKLLLRALKWEEQAGIDEWQHNSTIAAKDRGSKFKEMLKVSEAVRQNLMACKDALHKQAQPAGNDATRSSKSLSRSPGILDATDIAPTALSHRARRAARRIGTPLRSSAPSRTPPP